jgi:hypothetical protein
LGTEFFWRFVVVALAPLVMAQILLRYPGLQRWLISVRDWVIERPWEHWVEWLVKQPWGRWWWVPSALLLPARDLLVQNDPSAVAQKAPFAGWLSPTIYLLFAAVTIYGVFRRDYDAEQSRVAVRDALEDQLDAIRDTVTSEASVRAEEASIRAESTERAAREARIAVEQAERRIIQLLAQLLPPAKQE